MASLQTTETMKRCYAAKNIEQPGISCHVRGTVSLEGHAVEKKFLETIKSANVEEAIAVTLYRIEYESAAIVIPGFVNGRPHGDRKMAAML